MAKTKRPRGKREANITILCEWCGETREVSRGDARTCGDRCRARISFYVRTLGYRPDGIVGPLTAREAIDLEVHRLIMQEQRRRKAAKDEMEAYLNSPIGRKLSGIDAPHDRT